MTLVMIFEVKCDLHHKTWLVVGWYLVYLLDNSVYLSCVKMISVHLLNIIAHEYKLKQSYRDVGSTFIDEITPEKSTQFLNQNVVHFHHYKNFVWIGVVQFGLMYITYIYSYQFLESFEIAIFTIFTPIYVTLINDLTVRHW